jgi:hypothetical protein
VSTPAYEVLYDILPLYPYLINNTSCPVCCSQAYIDNPDFQPDKIITVSKAAYGLCAWVRAMEAYDRVVKVGELGEDQRAASPARCL